MFFIESGKKEERENMKVAIYCRLSEEDKNKQVETDDSTSIQNQKSMLIQHATEKQWEIYSIYSDDDYAGADRNRPEFNRLLADAERRKFDIVLCKTQSRFTREMEIVEKYIHGLFPIWNIRFVSVVDNADTEVKGNKKARQINGLINEWYLEDMSENIKSVLTNRRMLGYHIGSFPLYGYLKDTEKKGHLIVDEEAAAVVREVFTLYSQGYGKTAIARMLNMRGIPNPTQYKWQKGIMYKKPNHKIGTLWKYYSIADMLQNEMYIGNMVQGKYGSVSYKSKINKPIQKGNWIVVKGTHEPIISQELWDNVQSKINANYKPFSNGKIGLFAKKVRCMECGYILRSSKAHGKHYLKCTTRHIVEGTCKGSFISVKKLSDYVLEEINKMISEYLDKSEFEQKAIFENEMNARREKLKKEIQASQKKIGEYTNGIKNLYLDKVKGIITENDFIEFSKEFYQDKEKMENNVTKMQSEFDALEKKGNAVNEMRALVEQYVNVTELNREMVESLIECIRVGKRDPKSKKIPIEIKWNI